jgi:hypothetical protein
MTNLRSILNQLHQQRTELQKQVHTLDEALAVLGNLDHGGRISHAGRTRKLSKAGRERIAAAQRKRWAKVRGQKVVPITRKRTISAAARKRIVAAQKARWAKWRKEHR